MNDYKPCPTCKLMVKGDCQLCNPKKPQEFRTKDEIMRTESCKIAATMLSQDCGFHDLGKLFDTAEKIEAYIRNGRVAK